MQILSVDLVGPMNETARGNKWILVVTDNFTCWRDALPIPDGTAETVTKMLDERILCYLGLPGQIHSDQGAQFESELMDELCRFWSVEKSRTTPFHAQGNGLVERYNRELGDTLRSLLLGAEYGDWDLLLPHMMRVFRAIPHSSTGETANYLMFGRELKLPDQLLYTTPPEPVKARNQYVRELVERLDTAHQLLRDQQQQIRTEDNQEPSLFRPGDLVLMQNKRRRRGVSAKLLPKYVGPFTVKEAYDNHTYEIERQ